MSEYKRFTDKDWKLWYDEEFYTCIDEPSDEKIQEIYGRLAELEDKIENGTLIGLPCKVGDIVYRTRIRPYKAVLPRQVVSITYCLDYKGQVEWNIFTTTNDILGKSVFLTEAQAKARLEELEGNE